MHKSQTNPYLEPYSKINCKWIKKNAIFAFFTFCLKDTKNSHKEKTDSFSYIKELRKKKVASPKFREDT